MNTATTTEEVQSIDSTFARMNPDRKLHFPRLVGQLQAEIEVCGVPMTAIYVYYPDSHTADVIALYVGTTMVYDDVGDRCLLGDRQIERAEEALVRQHEGVAA